LIGVLLRIGSSGNLLFFQFDLWAEMKKESIYKKKYERCGNKIIAVLFP